MPISLSSALKENKKGGLAPASKYKERDIVILIDLTS